MHHMKLVLNIRLVALLAVTAAVLLAASILAPSRQASADHPPFDLDHPSNGGRILFCLDIYFDVPPLIPTPANDADPNKGANPGPGDVRAAKIMVRFDPITADTWTVTSEALQTGEFPPATDLTTPSCEDKGDNNKAPPPGESGGTPSDLAVPVATFDKANSKVVWTADCDFIPAFGLYILTEFNIIVDGDNTTVNKGTNRARLGTDPTICNDVGGNLIYAPMRVVNRVATTGQPDDTPVGVKDNVHDNWDGDNCSDWNELDPSEPFGFGSFNVFEPDCNTGVGGIAELADQAGTPLEAPDSSGSNSGLIAGIVAAIAAGTVTLGGAALYARRRSIQ